MHHLKLKWDLSVEAHIRIVHKGDQELELVHGTELLANLNNLLVQGLFGNEFLLFQPNLSLFLRMEDQLVRDDGAVLHLIADNNPETLLLQVWVLGRVHVAGEFVILEIREFDLDLDRDEVAHGHLVLALGEGAS